MTLVILTIALVACGNNGEDAEDTAAVVNEKIITVGDLNFQVENTIAMYGIDLTDKDDEYFDMIKQYALDGLITEILLADATEGYTVTDEEVNAEYEGIKAEFETEEQFNDALALNDLTSASLKERIQQQLKIDKFFFDNMSEIVVTEEELEELFEHFSQFEQEKLDYEEVRPLLEESLVQQKQDEEIEKILLQLRENANIEILI